MYKVHKKSSMKTLLLYCLPSTSYRQHQQSWTEKCEMHKASAYKKIQSVIIYFQQCFAPLKSERLKFVAAIWYTPVI